jgi:predicted ATPase/DNA-binding winged helix-turn-helix (wHTH) protein
MAPIVHESRGVVNRLSVNVGPSPTVTVKKTLPCGTPPAPKQSLTCTKLLHNPSITARYGHAVSGFKSLSPRYVMSFDRMNLDKSVGDSVMEASVPEGAVVFGPFVLVPQHHLLLKHGQPVALGSRAMLLLTAMATRPGELLEKAELLGLVWPRVVVEECNLRAQVLTLRRTLETDTGLTCIVTVPGRGYRFVAPITCAITAPASPTPSLAAAQPVASEQPGSTLSLSEVPAGAIAAARSADRAVFGREALLETLTRQLEACRFVTLTGPAGTGKTTVAQALIHRLQAHYPQGVYFIDLAPVMRGGLVHVVIAAALKIDCNTSDPLTVITRSLANSKALLVLDNCEHVLEEAAVAVEALLRHARHCAVLATSREPLRAAGESVHEVEPLPFPPTSLPVNAEVALNYPAVALLVEQIKSHDPSYVFVEHDAAAAAAICSKLDGNALAIEIAAARVRAFGMQSLAEILDGSFRLQMTGRRTALPRHRSLAAALDWTHAMLSPAEQSLLRQLSVFNGLFSLRAVQAVTELAGADPAALMESLMDKSLVVAREQGSMTRYRLLETTRLYAAQKLGEHAETDHTALRHALWMLAELKGSVQALTTTPAAQWLARYAADVDGVRTALQWAYSARGHRALAIELTLVSLPLWLRLSLTAECYGWVNRGLEPAGEQLPVPAHSRMLLLTASASLMVLTFGGGKALRQAWQPVADDAAALHDTEHRLRALWGLWTDHCCANQYEPALALADRYLSLSQSGQRGERQLLGLRMRATAQFHMGRLQAAKQSVLESLSAPLSADAHLIDLHFDQRIAARSLKAQIQLLQGDQVGALTTLEDNVNQAVRLNHPATLWHTLCLGAIPATLLLGQQEKAQQYLALLVDSMAGHDLYLWRQFARCFEHILSIRQGAAEASLPALGNVMEQLQDQGGTPLFSLIRCEYALGLAQLGLVDRAIELVKQTVQTAEAREERWFLPQLLRTKARLLLDQGQSPPVAISRLLNLALEEARCQGAHFWIEPLLDDVRRLDALNQGQPGLLCQSGH